ncbi:aminotransferase class I/II-fold pyridoxal phosphate-dependent enzyme [Sulfurisphaera tokodaii]|uniref:Aminotransferase n=2 Tax=Sulfurisphaera tokodaii TaxID=111955 RepID=Q976M5_SULTO|nr:aminotransferase class I/II-fold pyridoxal phosphate-dependent enzyme [Sulfurisphaera tokodaii]BAB65122.1 putative aminotransferase [Sulfurisphaera tokodaii str. 7]HII74277.1 histidinol-phosphate aminotransferase family protein [Sulfurisphaera tokodaii]
MKHGGVKWGKDGPEHINDFSVNLNPLGTLPRVHELIDEAVKKRVYSFYPPEDYKEIKEFIAELYNVDIDLIGVFNGSSEVIKLLDACDVPEPNFSEYKRKRSYFAIERENYFEYYLSGDCVITSNPVNPTGSMIKEKDIINFLSFGRKLILDESFADISLIKSSIKYTEEFNNLLIISSFTKSLSIPGLRIGFSIGKNSRKLEEKAPPWRINSIVYYVFVNLDPKEVRDFFERSKREIERLISVLKSTKAKFKIYDTVAPYFLAEFPIPTKELNMKLRKYGYQIREPEGFLGLRPTHGRISLKNNFKELIFLINKILDCEKLY